MDYTKYLYKEDGYVNMKGIIELMDITNCYQVYGVGARGIGKTFNGLSECKNPSTEFESFTNGDKIDKFIYLRRNKKEVDIAKKVETNPYKKLNRHFNWHVGTRKIGDDVSGFYNFKFNEEKNRDEIDGDILGYYCSLSTFAGVRSTDFDDVYLLFYDEFIKQKDQKPIKGEGEAYLNLIETVARNRELEGFKPLRVICMANANDAANPIFMSLGVVTTFLNMKKDKKTVLVLKDRGIILINFEDSPISKLKAETSLYKATKDTNFSKMALDNEFTGEDLNRIGTRNLKEFNPIVIIGELCIYRHKSKREYYVTSHVSGSPNKYEATEFGITSFRKDNIKLLGDYLNRNFIFEQYEMEILFRRYLKMNF